MHIGDRVEDFRPLIVVGEHDRVAFVLEPLNVADEIEVGLPLHQRHQTRDSGVPFEMIAVAVR